MKKYRPTKSNLSRFSGKKRLEYVYCIDQCVGKLERGINLAKAIPLVRGNYRATRAIVVELLSIASFMEKKFLQYEGYPCLGRPIENTWMDLRHRMNTVGIDHRDLVKHAMERLALPKIKERKCNLELLQKRIKNAFNIDS